METRTRGPRPHPRTAERPLQAEVRPEPARRSVSHTPTRLGLSLSSSAGWLSTLCPHVHVSPRPGLQQRPCSVLLAPPRLQSPLRKAWLVLPLARQHQPAPPRDSRARHREQGQRDGYSRPRWRPASRSTVLTHRLSHNSSHIPRSETPSRTFLPMVSSPSRKLENGDSDELTTYLLGVCRRIHKGRVQNCTEWPL